MSTQERYDAIILGSGPVESILLSLLCSGGKKVLQLDRNDRLGGLLPTVTSLEKMYARFGKSEFFSADLTAEGEIYNLDLMPKFFLAEDRLLGLLTRSGMKKHLNFKHIEASRLLVSSVLHAVPYDLQEIYRTAAIDVPQKKKLREFLACIESLDDANSSTWEGIEIDTKTINDVYTRFDLNMVCQQFIGHGLARYSTEAYRERPAREVLVRIRLSLTSFTRSGWSPYIYPVSSLGELSVSAARVSDLCGGSVVVDASIESVLIDSDKKRFSGVAYSGKVARAAHLVGDPSYFPDRVARSGQVIRAICILDQPIPNTSGAHSQLIVIPGSEVGRYNDIYLTCVSSEHLVSPAGKFVVTICTVVEGDKPEQEIVPALNLLGPINKNAFFVEVSDVLDPIPSAVEENIFISRSYDAAPHFDSVYEDVRRIYLGITGEDLALEPTSSAEMANE